VVVGNLERKTYSICPLFSDLPVVHHIYIICLVENVEGMCYQYTSTIRERAIENAIIKYASSNICIYRGKWVVEKDNLRE